MPETTPTTTITPIVDPKVATKAPGEPTIKPTTNTGELDADDYAALERRFGIKRMPQKTESSEPTKEAKKEEPKSEEKAEPKPETEQKGPPKLKAKVDGEEIELDVAKTFPEFAEVWDKLSDTQKNRILAMYQKDLSASKRFSQANVTKKQMMELMTLLKEDPIAVLGHPSLNHNVRELVENWLMKQIEYENMDPKDKELADAKKALKEKEDLERRSKEEAERKEIETLQGKYTEQYQKEIIEAIESSGLPKSTETVARIAYYLAEALKPRKGPNGETIPGVRLNAIDVVDLVLDDYKRMMQRLVGQADADSLIKLFGDEFTEKIRKHLLKPIKDTGKTPEKQAAPTGEGKGQRKKLSKDEWRKILDSRTE